ncbi:MAG: PilZ domain-containing protein [Terriglobia bacterium]
MANSIDETDRPPQRVKAGIPVRVRGMSTRNKFFDEATETSYVGISSLITRIQNFVDLETELHIVNLNNNLSGTYRVMWFNVEGREGWHDLGLEQIEAEVNMWESVLAASEAGDAPLPHAWLQCQRCHGGKLTPVHEAEQEFIYDGFVISRPCDACKATTPWGFTPAEESKPANGEGGKEARGSGRAPLNMKIKVTRGSYGSMLEDLCETLNVSRTGACFLTRKGYKVGEQVKVIIPYKEGDVAIPVSARVVRLGKTEDGAFNSVAIQLEEAAKTRE